MSTPCSTELLDFQPPCRSSVQEKPIKEIILNPVGIRTTWPVLERKVGKNESQQTGERCLLVQKVKPHHILAHFAVLTHFSA